MPKTLGRNFKKRRILKNPLSFDSTHLTITPADIAEMAEKPGDIKLNRKKFPFTPDKVFRGKGKGGLRNAYSLAGVTKTLSAATKLATREYNKGYDIGRAKTRDGYAVYIANTRRDTDIIRDAAGNKFKIRRS